MGSKSERECERESESVGESEVSTRTLSSRLREALGASIGFAICAPKLRLGRRRHDGICDDCGDPLGQYAGEQLDFPLDDLSPEATTSTEKLRAMWNAEYRRICLECWDARERDEASNGDVPVTERDRDHDRESDQTEAT